MDNLDCKETFSRHQAKRQYLKISFIKFIKLSNYKKEK